ncbi:MAG: hypothetical protein ACKO0Z_05745 [Betaproteobacteria bacterium]
MTRDANPPILKPKHIVTIELPLDIADQLIAKAGTMDEAVYHAITEYLRTDHHARNARIKDFVAKGSDPAKLADFHGLPVEAIMEIADK